VREKKSEYLKGNPAPKGRKPGGGEGRKEKEKIATVHMRAGENDQQPKRLPATSKKATNRKFQDMSVPF